MKKIIISLFFLLTTIVNSYSDITKGAEYECALTMYDGNDYPIKFPLKILKSYDDDFVVYSYRTATIKVNELKVFGKLYSNALIGYLYNDELILVEYFYYEDNQLIHYLFEIDKDQSFPYTGGDSLFIVKEKPLIGFTQGPGVKAELNEDQFNLEREIFYFIDNHIKQITDNEKNHLFLDKSSHKCKIKWKRF